MKIALIIGALINTLILLPAMLFQVITGYVLYLLGKLLKNKKLKVHGIGLAIAADQNINSVWLGDPDETISSRMGRAKKSGKPKWFIKYILLPFVDWAAQRFGGGPNHSIEAIEKDESYEREIWRWYK